MVPCACLNSSTRAVDTQELAPYGGMMMGNLETMAAFSRGLRAAVNFLLLLKATGDEILRQSGSVILATLAADFDASP